MRTHPYLTILASLAMLELSIAHPGHEHAPPTLEEKNALSKRVLKARSCSSKVKRHFDGNRASLGKRALQGRTSTCVTEPESVEGPYYIRNEMVRNDVRENSEGLDVELDIQIIDLATCEPVTDAFVEIWHANATGSYSGFASNDAGSTSDTGATGTNDTMSGAAGTMSMPNASDGSSQSMVVSSGTQSGAALPTGTIGGNDTTQAMSSGGGAMTTTGTVDNDFSFLRGGNFVGSNGNITLMTKFPGYYTGRTNHIHVHVFQNASINANGTLASINSVLHHTGQLFFEQDMVEQTKALAPYNETTQVQTVNTDDSILQALIDVDYSPYVHTELVGSTLAEGLIGYMAIVIDTSEVYTVSDPYYATTFDSSVLATGTATGSAELVDAVASTAGSATTSSFATSSTATTSTGGAINVRNVGAAGLLPLVAIPLVL